MFIVYFFLALKRKRKMVRFNWIELAQETEFRSQDSGSLRWTEGGFNRQGAKNAKENDKVGLPPRGGRSSSELDGLFHAETRSLAGEIFSEN